MFDADRAKRISEDVLKALKAVEDRHGVTFHLGRMTGGVTLRMQLECATVGEGGRAFGEKGQTIFCRCRYSIDGHFIWGSP